MKTGTLALLQPDVMARAVKTFDRASGVLVLAVWGAAITFMILAYIGVQQTISSRQLMVQAQATQPILPEISQEDVPSALIDNYVKRVANRYGGKVNVVNNAGEVKISATTADAYTSWMGAVSYLDTIAPGMTWVIKDMCIGPKCQNGLMSVQLAAKKISFIAPPPAE